MVKRTIKQSNPLILAVSTESNYIYSSDKSWKSNEQIEPVLQISTPASPPQSDLGSISSEILSLQQQSVDMNLRLRNRQVRGKYKLSPTQCKYNYKHHPRLSGASSPSSWTTSWWRSSWCRLSWRRRSASRPSWSSCRWWGCPWFSWFGSCLSPNLLLQVLDHKIAFLKEQSFVEARAAADVKVLLLLLPPASPKFLLILFILLILLLLILLVL